MRPTRSVAANGDGDGRGRPVTDLDLLVVPVLVLLVHAHTGGRPVGGGDAVGVEQGDELLRPGRHGVERRGRISRTLGDLECELGEVGCDGGGGGAADDDGGHGEILASLKG